MAKKRKTHSSTFKAKVALESIKGLKTASQIASQHGVHVSQLHEWKRHLFENSPTLFESGQTKRNQSQSDDQQLIEQLYQQVGKLQMELEFVKKNLPCSSSDKRPLVEPDHPNLSIRQQCELLNLPRSSFYLTPNTESKENLDLMKHMDRIHMEHPFFGSRQMSEFLKRQGHQVNRKRIQRLMRLMRIEAVYPKPKTTRRNLQHKVFPYLLRDVPIERVNQVWSSDITYVPMKQGFLYLVAVIDWYSRYVLSWKLSNTLDGLFCLECLEDSLTKGTPDVFNTDQGVQFTSHRYTGCWESAGIQVSMDGKGRALDNVWIERLWRSVKYEELYLKSYDSGEDLYHSLGHWFDFYHRERPHQGLGNQTPEEVYNAK